MHFLMNLQYCLTSHLKDDARVKCLASEHKCHNWELNPHSDKPALEFGALNCSATTPPCSGVGVSSNILWYSWTQLNKDLGRDTVKVGCVSPYKWYSVKRSLVSVITSVSRCPQDYLRKPVFFSRVWVCVPVMTLVSLSETLNCNCFSPPSGK